MRTRIGFLFGYPGIVMVAALVLLTPASATIAQSNTNRQQQIYLPDPTPRPPDLRLLLGDNAQAGTSTPESLEQRNAKRRELVQWGANELVILSKHLEAELTKPKTSDSMATAAANAEKIEQLAKNLKAAMKAP